MLLQTGPTFTIPFAFAAGFGLLLVLAGIIVFARFDEDGAFSRETYRAMAAGLVAFGLGLVAIALDFAGIMAPIQAKEIANTPEPTLLGRIGMALPWMDIAVALFVVAALAIVVATVGVVRAELG